MIYKYGFFEIWFHFAKTFFLSWTNAHFVITIVLKHSSTSRTSHYKNKKENWQFCDDWQYENFIFIYLFFNMKILEIQIYLGNQWKLLSTYYSTFFFAWIKSQTEMSQLACADGCHSSWTDCFGKWGILQVYGNTFLW